ncbi:MAG: hypothetical protein ACLFPL_05695 [Candidatus Nanoarchaeia archaeon]
MSLEKTISIYGPFGDEISKIIVEADDRVDSNDSLTIKSDQILDTIPEGLFQHPQSFRDIKAGRYKINCIFNDGYSLINQENGKESIIVTLLQGGFGEIREFKVLYNHT